MVSVPVRQGLASGLICVAMVLPFLKNYKYGDNHLNWLNHDYSKNLLISTEPYSVFMTEGGDNQVFGTLYFRYAEKVRPDLLPYDQKGNIFKRIYGDMRYVPGQTVERRMDLVDRHLFRSEEPFYKAIRSPEDPYFVPYWTNRKTYLTWKRPHPGDLGDYYYRLYGRMYRVQHIRYAMVDYLSIAEKASRQTLQRYVERQLEAPVDSSEMTQWLNELVQEGLVRVQGNQVTFVQNYPQPQGGEFATPLLERWKDIPNVRYLEYLAREIISSAYVQQAGVLKDRAEIMQEIQTETKDPALRRRMAEQIQALRRDILAKYREAYYYGEDSLSAVYALLNFLRESRDPARRQELLDILRRSIEYYPNSWYLYTVIIQELLISALLEPRWGEDLALEANEYLLQAARKMSKYSVARVGFFKTDYTRHPQWRSLQPYQTYLANFQGGQLAGMKDRMLAFNKEVLAGQWDANRALQLIQPILTTIGPFLRDSLVREEYAWFTDSIDLYLEHGEITTSFYVALIQYVYFIYLHQSDDPQARQRLKLVADRTYTVLADNAVQNWLLLSQAYVALDAQPELQRTLRKTLAAAELNPVAAQSLQRELAQARTLLSNAK